MGNIFSEAWDDAVDFVEDVIDGVIDLTEGFVGDIYDLTKSVWDQAWDNFLEPLIKPIFGLLGFTDETIINTQVSTIRFYETEDMDRLTQNILQAQRLGADLSKVILYSNLTGSIHDVRQMVQYGNNGYIHGLPTSTLFNKQVNISAVDTVITTEVGEAITIISSFLSAPDIYTWAKWWMQENEPLYNYNTNTIFLTPTTWDVVGATGSFGSITVTLDNVGTPGSYGPITAIPTAGVMYYIVDYELDSAPGVKINWLYDESSGTHPTLDVPPGTGTTTSNILPIIPIRKAGVNINATPNSTEAQSIKRMLALLKLDLTAISDGFTKQTDGNGQLIPAPNIDQITDIYIFFGVNIYGQGIEEKYLLYQMFNTFFFRQTTDKTDYDAAVTAGNVEIPLNVFTVREGSFDYALSFNYVTKVVIAGRVTEVGKHVFSYTEAANLLRPEGGNVQSYVTAQYQHSVTDYTEIVIHGIHAAHIITTSAGTAVTAINLEAYTPGATRTAMQNNFVIPIPDEYFYILTPIQADRLYSQCVHGLVYAAEIVELEFYETPKFINFFNSVVKVVALVMLVYDWSGSTSKALWALAKYILIKYAFEYVLKKLLIEFADDPDKQAAIIALAIIASYFLPGGDNATLDTADRLLRAVNVTTTATNTYVATQTELLEKEQADFLTLAEDYHAEIQAAQDFLDVRSTLTPNMLIEANRGYIYERPDDFFLRTLNTAPGQATFDQLHNYVDNNLNLGYIRV